MKISEKIIDIIRDKKTQLPTLPVIVEKILRIAQEDDTSAKDLADFVTNDQAIANKILRLANSAYYGVMKQIDSIPRAITIIGFNEVVSLTIGMSVISSFRQKNLDGILNIRDLWIHSIACAYSAKELSKKTGFDTGEQIFLNGLLHDTGKVIFALYFPEEYRTVLSEADNTQSELYEKEKQILHIDHATLTGMLMERWHFPDNLLIPTRFHHNPEKCPPKHLRHTLIVKIADYICHKADLGCSGNPVVPGLGEAIEQLKLSRDVIDQCIEGLKEQRAKIEEFFEMIG